MSNKVLLASTEDYIKRERSSLASDVASGTSVTFVIANPDNISANDYIVIGWEGGEIAEMAKVTNVSGTNVTVDLLKLSHKTGEPITKYQFNKRKFYGSTTAGGTYVELTGYGSPVQIQVDDPQGTFLEYTGSEGYLYFKSTYFNSQTNAESDIANSTETLADESKRYCSLYAIRKQANLTNNPYVTDGLVETYRRRAESEVNSFLNSHYILPLTNSTGSFEVPYLIENVTTLLAAGYIDYQEFGKDGQGVKWLGEARSILKQLQTPGGMQLLGADMQQMQERTRSSGIRSYPDQVDNSNGPDQKFTMRQKF
jgi:hypothetical protein